MPQLGFTFYPKDWWTSDSFFTLNPFERYIYLELLFMMYVNDGFVANNKVNVERRLFTTIKEDVWLKITDLMVKDGDQLTHRSVNARLRKTLANRENGLKGGRPDLEMELTALDGKVIPREPNAGDHFIYLFRNLSNNTYKIGETKDLFKRRLTIKIPTADLKIIHFEFIDRSKNLEIERHLKLRFIDKQISGDWFSLTNGDVNELITEMERLKKPNNPLNNQLNNPPSEKNRIEIEKNRIEVNRKEKKEKGTPTPHPDYLKFQVWVKANAPRVSKMEKPITEKEFTKLKDEFGHQVMMDYLTRMENYKPLLKNSTSANLTLRKWIAGDKEKKQQSDLPIYKQGMVR